MTLTITSSLALHHAYDYFKTMFYDLEFQAKRYVDTITHADPFRIVYALLWMRVTRFVMA